MPLANATGTLISLSAHQNHEVLEPIYARLEDEHSLLRRSGDVSMLCHALVDVCEWSVRYPEYRPKPNVTQMLTHLGVDLAVEIIQAFEGEILKCESEVLVAAQVSLFILFSDTLWESLVPALLTPSSTSFGTCTFSRLNWRASVGRSCRSCTRAASSATRTRSVRLRRAHSRYPGARG